MMSWNVDIYMYELRFGGERRQQRGCDQPPLQVALDLLNKEPAQVGRGFVRPGCFRQLPDRHPQNLLSDSQRTGAQLPTVARAQRAAAVAAEEPRTGSPEECALGSVRVIQYAPTT